MHLLILPCTSTCLFVDRIQAPEPHGSMGQATTGELERALSAFFASGAPSFVRFRARYGGVLDSKGTEKREGVNSPLTDHSISS